MGSRLLEATRIGAIRILSLAFLLVTATVAHSQNAAPAPPPVQLARTPPMGWNSWNKFGCDVSESLIRRTADAMVSSGMKDTGYEYVVIDDCWQVDRDAQGNIVADPERFPSGMKALADYVHSKGLKFGLYSDAGEWTCEGRPGSQGHEFRDAAQYAAWGVDYLKYDWCNTGTRNSEEGYGVMARALKATGRPIILSICEWGTTKPWLWARGVGHLWRTTFDIRDKWQYVSPETNRRQGVLDILDQQVGLESFSGPDGWNDPDMLQVGNGGMTQREYGAHFSIWAMLAAPLIAGNDIGNMDAETREILTNREIIAVDQDPLGRQAVRVSKQGELEVWARPLADGGRAIMFLNRGETPAKIGVAWEALGYPKHLRLSVRDLWRHMNLPAATSNLAADVQPHEAVVYQVMPVR